MHEKKYEFFIKYKLSIAIILVTWIVFFNLKPDIIVFLVPVSIVHFLYLHKDYKVEISDSKINLYSLFKLKRDIEMTSVMDIVVGEERIKQSIFGPKRTLSIITDFEVYDFDIYRFDSAEIVDVLRGLSVVNGMNR